MTKWFRTGFVPGEIRSFGCRFGRKPVLNDKRGVNGLGSTALALRRNGFPYDIIALL